MWPWVKTEDYWEVKWDVTREVKMRFDREGITIPFPQRDVHLHGNGHEPPREHTDPGGASPSEVAPTQSWRGETPEAESADEPGDDST